MKYKCDEPGVWVGGGFFPSKDGVLEVPDNVVGLEQLGYTKIVESPKITGVKNGPHDIIKSEKMDEHNNDD